MRYLCYLLLTVLTFIALGPGSSLTVVFGGEHDAVLGALDVCHRSAPALSSGGEMPCVHSCLPHSRPIFSVLTGAAAHTALGEFILISLNDHPPKDLR
jgi:hypothetical protein